MRARARRWTVTRPRSMFVLAAVGAVLIVVAVLGARHGTVGKPEEAVFHAVNGLPDWLRWPMWIFQLAGLIGLPIVVAAVALLLRRWRLAVGCVLAALIKLYVEQPLFKDNIDRQRPGSTVSDPVLRDVPASGASFPSGHAVVAFALATMISPYLPGRWKAVVWVIAMLNSAARVYLGAHNPLDVVAGAGAGLIIGAVLTLVLGVQRRPRTSDATGAADPAARETQTPDERPAGAP